MAGLVFGRGSSSLTSLWPEKVCHLRLGHLFDARATIDPGFLRLAGFAGQVISAVRTLFVLKRDIAAAGWAFAIAHLNLRLCNNDMFGYEDELRCAVLVTPSVHKPDVGDVQITADDAKGIFHIAG